MLGGACEISKQHHADTDGQARGSTRRAGKEFHLILQYDTATYYPSAARGKQESWRYLESAGGPRGGCAGQRRLAARSVLRGDWGTSRYSNGASIRITASHGSRREAMVQ